MSSDAGAIGMRQEVRTIDREVRGQIIGKDGRSIAALRTNIGAYIKITDQDFLGKSTIAIRGKIKAVQEASMQLDSCSAREYKRRIMSVCSKISGKRNYFAPAHVDYLSEVELPIVWDHQDTNDAYKLLPYDIKLALESKPIISKFADNWDLEVEKKNENSYFINYAEWIGRLIAGIDK